MQEAPETADETKRLAKLESYNILDSLPEQLYDDIVEIASQICGTPIALISLVDKHRQWFKSRVGLDATETSREIAFCSHAIHHDQLFYIPDAKKDLRFHDNPLVTGDPKIAFYAGAPIITPDGHRLGTVCAIDNRPRDLSDKQKNALVCLARQVASNLELRANMKHLAQTKSKLERINDELSQFAYRTSHDLKAPITSSKGLVSFMLKDIELGDLNEAARNGGRVKTLLGSLEDLISDITSLVKADLDTENSESVSIGKLLDEIELRLSLLCENNTCQILRSVSGPDSVCIEKGRIRQIIENLMSNSIKYQDNSKDDRFVKVNILNGETRLSITVEDNGVGIPEKHRQDVFKMFKRFHPGLGFGSGLGMSIVNKHVVYLGGTIDFLSSKSGTTFTVKLPIVDETLQS